MRAEVPRFGVLMQARNAESLSGLATKMKYSKSVCRACHEEGVPLAAR